jgi:Protein of unknown function (DUF2946)
MMRFNHLSRLVLALWLGIGALAANAFEQQQLTINILEAVASDAHTAESPQFHVMPDGTVMAGTMGEHPSAHHHDAGGHTHKGHADCEVCGTVATLAAITLPILPILPVPRSFSESTPVAAPESQFYDFLRTPYASRAPPSQLI